MLHIDIVKFKIFKCYEKMNPDLPEVADHYNRILHFSVIVILLSSICHAGSSSH